VVDKLVKDVLGEGAALPLLQFTLRRLWMERERNRVTLAAYGRVGGGRLALTCSADALYDSLMEEQKRVAKEILLRLVQTSEGLELTGRRVLVDDLYVSSYLKPRVDEVLGKLVDGGLIRRIEGGSRLDAQVEVAHEALVRNWTRFVQWLEAERANIRRGRRIRDAAQQWVMHGRDEGDLLRGRALEEVTQLESTRLVLTRPEREFLEASRVLAERNELAKRKQRR
jgi:hypothetical protein